MKTVSLEGVSDTIYFTARSLGIDSLKTIRLTEEGSNNVFEYNDYEVFGYNYQYMVVPNTDMKEGRFYNMQLIDQYDDTTVLWEGRLYATSNAGNSFDSDGKYPHTINKDKYSIDINDDDREYIILED